MKKSPYLRYTYNDLVKNKGVNFALIVMLVLSAFLMATGAMVMERMVGSVNQLFDEAKPPHFLQMHKGDYDPEALAEFADEQPDIEAWHVEEMLGYASPAIAWERPATGESGDFSDSLINNLFVTPNEEFDFLLDETGAIPQPAPGEVYVPVAYQQSFDLHPGDELTVQTDAGFHELRIEGFIRDSQMASSMSSSTRFLISDPDFSELENAGGGEAEIIVEYRLTDQALAADFQRAYESEESLPKNGQAVTYQMILMINAFSDGLVAVALVFVSLLLIAIALLNVRFVIRGKLEDEVREIGAMKAIGIPNKAISRLYLAKYSVMTLAACIIGGLLAIVATGVLTQNIQANYAEAPIGFATLVVPVLALILVYLFVILICRGVLRSVRKIEVVGAMVHGSTVNERQTARRAKRLAKRVRRTSLASARPGRVNRRLAWLDLLAESRQWLLIPLVFFLAAVLMALPMNLLSTFQSPQFVTYMGAPERDLRADVQFSEEADMVREDILQSMQGDDRLTDQQAFAHVMYETEGDEGWENLRVEVGDYSRDTVEFVEGAPPEAGQIALSVLNADQYEASTGDELDIREDGQSTTVEVSGVYQDVTSGGYTAKMHGDVATGAAGYVIYADAVAGEDIAAIAAEYNEQFPAAAVIPMQEYVQQTLEYMTNALASAAILAFVFGIGVALLITSLFLGLRLVRDRRKMGALSAIGFSTKEIIAQLRSKTLIAVIVGTGLGLAFAATAGESLVGSLISMARLGIADLSFIPNPWLVYLAYPLVLIGTGYLSAVVITRRLHSTDKSTWLR